ncbi:glycosyltransferase family 4 protein [Fulvivirga maritima]|uniref:glycosyltransferase family 4 protein n=1 Tax=Fulvivirga maritima TaxID=2904247 RepID=UPI001F3C56AC|nr:glycosyltransferase family 4 protein [Fulvivirga maritima]UII24561.1 glycosyltransferase family 4 protein [Fulvivirga maritima]
MSKVLIITYYWPPSGGGGVQRWLKFTKYLPEFGWEPFVYTPENPHFEVKDTSLEKDVSNHVEVIKFPIWEPYYLIDKFKKKGHNQQSDVVKKSNTGLFTKLMLWVRGNFFIPDPRKFWLKPSVKVIAEILQSNGIDKVITTGPPHSMHLIGLKLKQKYNIQWIADFRDPWSKWELLDTFHLSWWARRRHEKLERKVLDNADRVMSVSKNFAGELAEIAGRKVEVITNGFDHDEFDQHAHLEPDEFIIRHVGVVDELRDPRPVLKAIKELHNEGKSFKLEFIGNVNKTLQLEIENDEALSQLVTVKPYMPHAEVLKMYRRSAVLLLLSSYSKNAPGHIPGKLFEYLASERPILALGSTEGDSAEIIKETGVGVVCGPDEVQKLKDALVQMHEDYASTTSKPTPDVSRFSRRNLTKKLADLLNEL